MFLDETARFEELRGVLKSIFESLDQKKSHIESLKSKLSMQSMDIKTLNEKVKGIKDGAGQGGQAVTDGFINPELYDKLKVHFTSFGEFNELSDRLESLDEQFESVQMVTESTVTA